MSLGAGERLGPYEILAPIGAGGMGEVYKARDTRLDRIVAIKVSKTEFSERFEREAHAVAAFNHPHICQLYDVGPNYLVMEYIEGTPLKGPLPVDRALKYACQICDALARRRISSSRAEFAIGTSPVSASSASAYIVSFLVAFDDILISFWISPV